MTSRFFLVLFLAAGVFFSVVPLQAQTPSLVRGALVDTTLALPASSRMGIRWILPPNRELAEQTRQKSPSRGGPEYTFSVDSFYNAWIGVDGRRLLNPATSFRAVMSEPYQNFIHLDQGAMIFSTVRHLGFMGMETKTRTDKDGWPIIPFQPITAMPNYYSRLYKGTGDCLYLVAGSSTSGKSTIYLLAPETGRSPGSSSELAVRSFQKLLETEEPVTAVGGDGKTTFIAFGKLVVRFSPEMGSMAPFSTQPMEEVRELVYMPNVGLFYASTGSVGFLGNNRNLRFLETPFPKLCLRDRSLYVFFPKSLGVAAFDNIDEFKKTDLP